jgi:hypothetical protein
MSAPPNRQYSRFIVAPDTWPTNREDCEAKATAWQHAAAASRSAADAHRTAINGLRAYGVAQSKGFEAMHASYWRNQVKADDLTDTRRAAADLMRNVSRIQQEAEHRIDSIDADAHQQLTGAPLRSPMAIGIISSAAALVRTSAADAASSITALSANFASRFGPVPESPGKSPGSDQTDGGERPSPPGKSTDKATADDFGGAGRPDATPQPGLDDTGKVTATTSFGGERPIAAPPVAAPAPAPAPSPLRSSVPSGIPSFGGGGAGASPLLAAGGVGGFGGRMPSGLGGGLSPAGSAGSATASGSASPAAALSRALPVVPPTSFTSGAGVASPPATAAAPPPVIASAAPLLAAPSGISHAPVAAAPGVVPQSVSWPATSSVPAQPISAAPLLPPGPMGPPPAAVTAAPPGATGSLPGPAGAMGPASASVMAAAAVATPVATLPSQVAAAAQRDFERQRNESNDLLVKRVAWELLYATESGRSFALWAVGVMYSATGECQVAALTHHGAGYVPAGIAVPAQVRMLWSDPVISDSFRARWTGNLDPAATLVAYAELKAAEPAAWRLAAAATTWTEVEALIAAARHWGTDWATCPALTMPTSIRKDTLASGADTAHRLVREFPELAERVTELQPRGLSHRAAKLITDALVGEARLVAVTSSTMPGDSRLPANFDVIWPAAAESTMASAERARFAEAVQQQWLSITVVQPGWDGERSAGTDVEYRSQWLISRALEAVLGWIADTSTDTNPAELPVSDIVYAAAHAHLDDRGTGWITDFFDEAEKPSR